LKEQNKSALTPEARLAALQIIPCQTIEARTGVAGAAGGGGRDGGRGGGELG